jgi:hypothetical protein
MADKIPDYAFAPIERCKLSLLNMLKLLHICADGISIVRNRPKMVQRVIDLTGGEEVSSDLKSDLEKATKDAEFAENELKNNLPFLHASMLIGAWGALEAAVEDTLIGISLNEPGVLDKDEFRKVRIPLYKFGELDREERIRFLLEEVERTQGGGVGSGVENFEKLLRVFGLSGPIESKVSKKLWEMNHVRNVIVHRDSRADARLVEACPWLGLKVGDRVLIDFNKYGRYSDAVFEYLKVLARRLAGRYDSPIPYWATLPPVVETDETS